jgi:hypothetical protein
MSPDKRYNIYDQTGFLLYANCINSLRAQGFETGSCLLLLSEIKTNRWIVEAA